jgi:hypothetical protein
VELQDFAFAEVGVRKVEFEPSAEKTAFEVRAALRHLRRVAPERIHIRLIDGGEITEFK